MTCQIQRPMRQASLSPILYMMEPGLRKVEGLVQGHTPRWSGEAWCEYPDLSLRSRHFPSVLDAWLCAIYPST